MSKEELLAQAIQAGASISEFINKFVELNPPSEREVALINKAREQYVNEGVLEIDEPTIASIGDDPGGYVLAWVWVYDKVDDEEEEEG